MVSAESQAAMEAAKKAVAEFMNKNGRRDTIVYEKVAPAVYHETISRNEHEEQMTVVDREVNQSHYHLSIQPITDEDTLPEEHQHRVLPIETRKIEHDDVAEVQARLDTEHAKFQNKTQRVEGHKTQSTVSASNSEHLHHYVYELIQPVVNKHTIEPIFVHQVVRVHEVVHNASKHHATSALPAVSMAEFKKQGGVLTGREERFDFFEGEPRSVGGGVGNVGAEKTTAPHSAPIAVAGHEQPTEHHETQHAPEHAASAAPAAHSADAHPTPEHKDTQAHPTEQHAAATKPQQATPAPSPAHQPEDHAAPARRPTFPKATDKPLPAIPTPSAAAVTEGSKLGEGRPAATLQQQQQQQQPTSAQPAPAASAGRWNLLPYNLGHSPIRPAQAHPQAAPAEGQQASVAQSQQGQQQQGQQGEQRRGS